MNSQFQVKHVLRASALVLLSNSAVTQAQSADSDETQDIVISASRVEMAREASGSSITVVDNGYMEQNQVRIVSDVLRDIPGVAVNRSGGVGSFTQVRIRGAEANQTLVLIDGMEVNDVASNSEFDFGNLLNLEVERVEVLRGAQSALWGSDAMGGVINIITKKGKGNLNGRVSLEGGSIFGNGSGSNQESFSLNAGNDFYNYALSGSLLSDDGISTLSDQHGNVEKDGYRNNSYNFKGGLNPLDNLSFELVVRHLKAETETDLFSFGVGPVDGNGLTRTNKDFLKASANLDLLGGDWKQKWAISANKTNNDFFENKAITFNSQGKKKKYEYQSDYFLNVDKIEHRFTFAAEKEDLDFYSKGFSVVDRNTQNSAYVIEYGANVNSTVFATISGRRDLNDDFKNANTYRFTLAGWANDNTRLHGSKGVGIKNPDFFELFGSTSTFTGNPNLKPEQNTTWDVGAEYHFVNTEGYLDLTYFRNDVDKLISGFGNTAINLPGKAVVKGVELSAKVEPTKSFRFNASYTFTDSDDGAGNELVRRPRNIASVNSSYLLPNGKTRVTGGIQFNGQQDDTTFDAFFTPSTVTLASYTLVNIALEHKVNQWMKAFARIENLTDKNYQEIAGNGSKGISATMGVTLNGAF